MMAARSMVQARGYNSLSFRDLAKEVGIKSSSIHYYFPTKGDLGAALAYEYTDEFLAYLNQVLSTSKDRRTCIKSYVDVFRATLVRENRMCLGGIMAAEYTDLADEVKTQVHRFTHSLVDWLLSVLLLGEGEVDNPALKKRAFAIFAAVEGAQLVARGCEDVAVYDDILEAYWSSGLFP
jgi:TetR/AcrR family transcriptional repressor of nem operon